MMQQDEKQLRKLAEKNLKKRNEEIEEFFWHLGAYVAVNFWAWSNGGNWAIWMTIFWGLGLISHAVDTYNKVNHKARDRRERAIQQEMARLRGDEVMPEKAKRKVKLGDDGELVEEEADEFSQDDQRRQQSQY
jgi:2TM domain